MKKIATVIFACIFPCLSGLAFAQVPVSAQSNQQALISSTDARLAHNKKLVYDFWREVVEAGHTELAERYLAPNYIQHNPNVASGRTAFIELIAKNVQQQPIQTRVKAPLVAVVAEGNFVIFSLASEIPDPKTPGKTYTTTWFDMFRIEDGKIAEHWDSALKL